MQVMKHVGVALLTFVIFVGVDTVKAGDAEDIPSFIVMRGDWASVGVRAEPAAVFEEMPEFTQPHLITAIPTAIKPGVQFTVDQTVGGTPHKTALTYYYDNAAGKSFGLIASDGGPPMRAIITHHDDFDTLDIYNADGDVVWSERSVWKSSDLFESEATFPFDGGAAKVWFVTERQLAKDFLKIELENK